MKKLLTKSFNRDNINELLLRATTKRRLITEQWNKPWINTSFYLNMYPWNSFKFLNETKPLLVNKSVLYWFGIKFFFNMRVWSWLRMNAGGVLNTCKSNEATYYDPFGVTICWLSGGRVSNAWVTYLVQGDNSWKRLLIPHKRTISHDIVWKSFSV